MKNLAKTKFFCLLCLLVCFLTGSCAKTTDYPQFTLTEPDRILITQGSKSVEYDKNSPAFEKIFVPIQDVWWKKNQNYEMVTNGRPTKVLTQLSEENIDNQTIMVSFLYDTPIAWTDAFEPGDIKTHEVSQYVFFPFGYNSGAAEESNEVSDVGIMAVEEDGNLYNQNNVYVFLYSSAIRDIVTEIITTNDSKLSNVIDTTKTTTDESTLLAFQNRVDEQVELMDQASIPEDFTYYSGRYIENQKTLIVAVTCSPDTFKSEYSNLLDFSFIQVKQVKYTYKELEAAREILNKEWLKSDRLSDMGIIGHGVDEKNNAVLIVVLELNDEIRNEVAKLIPDSGMIEFEIGEEIIPY